jgi:prepilin-type N-terminal cleavage/methylation domain-containing protein
MNNLRKGFTLIEILIVVAIIAILASVVLVGLGPTQSLGRDARRVSDLHETQNGLELYYNSKGSYPIPASGAAWSTVQSALTGASLGISSVPDDPSGGAVHYAYGTDAAGTQYILEGDLENNSGGSWNGYSIPGNLAKITVHTALSHSAAALACNGSTAAAAPYQYCITL